MTLLTLAKLIRRLYSADRRDRLDNFQLLRDVAAAILPDYRFKWPQMDWWADASFTAYLERFGEADGNNTDRRWAVYQLLRLTEAVDGDTAEVGVYQGAMSYLVLSANGARKHHHLLDSFEGLSKPGTRDGTHWSPGALACTEADVQSNLSRFEPHFSCHQGWVPHRFADVAADTFSFVHIDVDLYQPTRDSLEFFYPRMNQGGIIVCDDYGFSSCPGATDACDECLHDKPEKMIALSDGGGFFIKGTATGAAANLASTQG